MTMGKTTEIDALFSKEDYDNAMRHWRGVPGYDNVNLLARKSITVHFASEEDFKAFCSLIGQKLTLKSRSTWYPAMPRTQQKDKRWVAKDKKDSTP